MYQSTIGSGSPLALQLRVTGSFLKILMLLFCKIWCKYLYTNIDNEIITILTSVFGSIVNDMCYITRDCLPRYWNFVNFVKIILILLSFYWCTDRKNIRATRRGWYPKGQRRMEKNGNIWLTFILNIKTFVWMLNCSYSHSQIYLTLKGKQEHILLNIFDKLFLRCSQNSFKFMIQGNFLLFFTEVKEWVEVSSWNPKALFIFMT